MPLSQECSVEAVSANIRKWMEEKADEAKKAGRSRKELQQQAIAVALSTLKKSCGVSSDARMTPKEIVAAGAKNEEAFGLAGPPKLFNPVRVQPTTAQPRRPIHRKAKSGKEQPFIDPGDFTVKVAARRTKKKLYNKSDAQKDSTRSSAKESRMRFSNLMMAALHENKDVDTDGDGDVSSSPAEDYRVDRKQLESFVLEKTSNTHKYVPANGGHGIVYRNMRGEAVSYTIEEMSERELLWLAREKGWEPVEDVANEDVGELDEDLEQLDERKAAGHIAKDLAKGIDMIAFNYANTARGGGVDVRATLELSNPMAPLIISKLVKALKKRPVDDHIHLSSIITKSVQDAARDSLGVSGRPDRDGEASIDRAIRLLVAYADNRVARVAKRAAKKLKKAKTFNDIGVAFQASA